MYENFNHNNDFDSGEEFGDIVESIVPSVRVPVRHAGVDLELTPANTAVRLFDEVKSDYNRIIVYMEDGSTAPLKPNDEGFLRFLVHSGFPVELPQRLDETDREFIDEFMKIWTENATAELEDLL
jgi:hypothetical protein